MTQPTYYSAIRSIAFTFSLIALPMSYASNTEPVTLRPSQTDFGGVGLMQMPTARMAPSGEFNLGVTINSDYHHYYTSMQLFPWLETTIRYTRVPDLKFSANSEYSGDNKYTDKGIDFKLGLLKESYWLPEMAVGVRDFGGTGLFDGEFIAASKRVGPLDLTLGLGWGYIGQRDNVKNPFCEISDRFCQRGGYTGKGGSFDVQRWFRGPSAIYGGLEYQTPYQPLRFKLEYDGNDYSQDFPVLRAANKTMTQHTPWNVGVLYQLGNWGDVKLSYQRGNTLTFGLNLFTNFDQLSAVWRDTPKPTLAPSPATSTSPTNWSDVAQQLDDNAGYKKNTIVQQDDTLIVTGEQYKYRNREEALDRAAIILANTHLPLIKTYRIIESRYGMPLTQTDIDVNRYLQVANNNYIGAKLADATTQEEPQPLAGHTLASDYQRWNLGISPSLTQSLGGPESFYLYDFGLNTHANYWLTDNIEASGSIYINLFDNYDKFNYVANDPHISNEAIPRVRTLFRSYVHDNRARLNNLQLTWFANPWEDIYTQFYGGYLETMFAGIGGEVLYRPMGENWAVSADINVVSQRQTDNWLKVYRKSHFYYDDGCTDNTLNCRAYVLDRGTTGHLTGYYAPQWSFIENTLIKVSVGKFLGGDKGARFDVSKQFKSGVIAGAYATVTDLTKDEYGEGSFNKGFYISIPFDVMTVKPSTNRAIIAWQPITRDGGQMLDRRHQLFDVTDARSPWYERKNRVKR